MKSKIPFLTAEWKNLLIVNYKINQSLLYPYKPEGVDLDDFNGEYFLSLIAFDFRKTKLLGFIPAFPAYSFEEINLRFYVRRNVNGEVKRAVTFIREVVPSRLITCVARSLYNEPYETQTTYQSSRNFSPDQGGELEYGFDSNGGRYSLSAKATGTPKPLAPGSFEHFILEHFWGYTPQPNGDTLEYEVKHPTWKYWESHSFIISESFKTFYGQNFTNILKEKPHSVFIADGSPISVFRGKRIKNTVSLLKNPNREPLGWVLYDAACGFCSWWIPFWRWTIQKTGFDIAPVQAKWVKDRVSIPADRLNNDIRLLLKNGEVVDGADAYIFGMKRVWWSKPVGYLLGFPGLRWLTWKFYKVFNRNRFLVSKICRLPPESE